MQIQNNNYNNKYKPSFKMFHPPKISKNIDKTWNSSIIQAEFLDKFFNEQAKNSTIKNSEGVEIFITQITNGLKILVKKLNTDKDNNLFTKIFSPKAFSKSKKMPLHDLRIEKEISELEKPLRSKYGGNSPYRTFDELRNRLLEAYDSSKRISHKRKFLIEIINCFNDPKRTNIKNKEFLNLLEETAPLHKRKKNNKSAMETFCNQIQEMVNYVNEKAKPKSQKKMEALSKQIEQTQKKLDETAKRKDAKFQKKLESKIENEEPEIYEKLKLSAEYANMSQIYPKK